MAKGNRVNTDFKQPENKKRGIAKKERGKGKLAMGKISQAEWTKNHDPLYGVKGMERHKKLKELRH